MRNNPRYWSVLAAAAIVMPTGVLAADGAAPARTAATSRLSSSPRIAIDPEHRPSIDRGMEWLLKTMRVNGMIGPDVGRPAELGCTAMLGMALLAEGNTPYGGPHSEELSKVLGAVLTMVEGLPSQPRDPMDATLVQRKIGFYADRFLAALFLSEIQGESGADDEDVRRALDKLVADICRAQGKDGTWGDESWAPVLGTVLGWECLKS